MAGERGLRVLVGLLGFVTGCEHASAALRGEPLLARLPPAAPPAAAAEAPALTPRAASGSGNATAFLLSDQAQRFLALQYRAFSTEFMGCMIGAVRGDTVVVERIAPADVEPTHSATTWVAPAQTCEAAGWRAVVGTIHSHIAGQRCWYFFPGTRVPSADAVSFAHTPYPVDAIMCGDHVAWISRQMEQRQVPMTVTPSAPPPRP